MGSVLLYDHLVVEVSELVCSSFVYGMCNVCPGLFGLPIGVTGYLLYYLLVFLISGDRHTDSFFIIIVDIWTSFFIIVTICIYSDLFSRVSAGSLTELIFQRTTEVRTILVSLSLLFDVIVSVNVVNFCCHGHC